LQVEAESTKQKQSKLRIGKKRRKVIIQKGKLRAEISRGREERLQILKRMAEKNRSSGFT
jgi:hypothetical protein